jgi:hypothetical protein
MKPIIPCLFLAPLVGCFGTINESIHVPAGAHSSRLVRSVNGDVRVGEGARVSGASTVNGSILVGRDCEVVNDLKSVNGAVACGEKTQVGGTISTVNGRIDLQGTQVAGNLTTYNGDMRLVGARVSGDIQILSPTHRGDGDTVEPVVVELSQGAEVLGGIRIGKEARDVEVRLSADSVIRGDLGRARVVRR